MTWIRGSKRFERAACAAIAAASLGGLACVRSRAGALDATGDAHLAPPPPRPSAESEDKDKHRRPDGVVLEPEPAVPPGTSRAEAGGVVALREPLAGGAIAALVDAVLDAWKRESIDALSALLTSDAEAMDARGRGRPALVDAWRQRLQAHEYRRLTGLELVRPERIQRWEYDDLAGPGEPARPAEMRPGDVYVRAPLEITRAAGEKLFGDVLVLVVRRELGGLRVAAYEEVDE